MGQSDEIEVSLKITGFDCSPDEISMLLGVPATKQWKKGDSINPSIKRSCDRRFKNSGWMLASGLTSDFTVKKQVNELKNILIPIKDRFIALPKNTKLSVYCVVYSQYGRPDISLSCDLLKAITEIGADLEFDLFALG